MGISCFVSQWWMLKTRATQVEVLLVIVAHVIYRLTRLDLIRLIWNIDGNFVTSPTITIEEVCVCVAGRTSSVERCRRLWCHENCDLSQWSVSIDCRWKLISLHYYSQKLYRTQTRDKHFSIVANLLMHVLNVIH